MDRPPTHGRLKTFPTPAPATLSRALAAANGQFPSDVGQLSAAVFIPLGAAALCLFKRLVA